MDIKVLGIMGYGVMHQLQKHRQPDRASGPGQRRGVQLEKVEDIRAIMGYGVMSTPGVVINGKVVHAGGVPSRDKIEQWLSCWPMPAIT
jgi:hypothetical protein